MQFQAPLIPARLIRRYKRFLADIRLESGAEVTAHCPNPGAMSGLADPGMRIWVEPNSDPRKKLSYGWRLVDHENGHFTCIDTSLANKMVLEALQAREIPFAQDLRQIRPEQRYGEKSRIDFLLVSQDTTETYLEVKSATLCRTAGLAEFPDTTTARGARHLKDLAEVISPGVNAAMLYVVQRTDCTRLAVAHDIDPHYAEAANTAREAGVAFYAISAKISPAEIKLGDMIPVSSM